MTWLLALPLTYLLWRTLARERIEYTHREAFTLGLLYYLGLPLFLAITTDDFGQVWLGPWRMIARMPGDDGLARMTEWSTTVWAAFLIGDALACRRRASAVNIAGLIEITRNERRAWTILLMGVTIGFGVFGVLWAASNRAILFTGYASFQEMTAAGALQSAIAFMTYISLVAALLRRALPRPLLWLALAVLGFLGVLTLSTGGRQTFVLSLIAALACWSATNGGVSRKAFVGIGASGVLLFGFIGAWRSGSIGGGPLFQSIALEPLFTFFSFTTLVAFTDLPFFALPKPLLLSFGNIVPSLFWPGKIEYFGKLLDSFTFYAPLGAINLGASLLINFGWVGALVATAVGGFAAERLRQGAMRDPLRLATYSTIVAVLTLNLWRNPMEISVVKYMFQVGLLLPVAMLIAKNLLAAAPRAAARPAVSTAE